MAGWRIGREKDILGICGGGVWGSGGGRICDRVCDGGVVIVEMIDM